MKVCVAQPYYSFDEKDLKQCFDGLISLLEQCDESMDVIVLPEYSDVLADVKGEGKDFITPPGNTARAFCARRAKRQKGVVLLCLSMRDTKPKTVFATLPTPLTETAIS